MAPAAWQVQGADDWAGTLGLLGRIHPHLCHTLADQHGAVIADRHTALDISDHACCWQVPVSLLCSPSFACPKSCRAAGNQVSLEHTAPFAVPQAHLLPCGVQDGEPVIFWPSKGPRRTCISQTSSLCTAFWAEPVCRTAHSTVSSVLSMP